MAYKIKNPKSAVPKQKNLFAKQRPLENPYEVWESPDGTWETRVLKKYQIDDNKPYARWFVATKSPFTHGSYDYGDQYVTEIKSNFVKKQNKDEGLYGFYKESDGKISDKRLSPYGETQLRHLQGMELHFKEGNLRVEGSNLIDEKGNVFKKIDNDRFVNKLMYRTFLEY